MFEFNAEIGTVRLYGEIGDYFEDGISERDVIKGLDLMGGQDITISMKSDGGDVFQGLSIYNQLVNYSGKVSIVIDGIAASIASVIAMAGDDIAIHSNSMLMIHNPWTVAMGDATEFRGVADLLDKIGSEIAAVYANSSGRDKEYFVELMSTDTYFTADEALESGLVDRIVTHKKEGAVKNETAESISCVAAFPKRIAAKHKLRKSRLK